MCTHSFITASLCYFMLVCKHQLSNIKKAFKFGHKKNILQVQRARLGKLVLLNFGWKKCVCFNFVLSNIYLYIWLLFLSLWRLLLPKYNFVNVHISVSENYTISATYVCYFHLYCIKCLCFSSCFLYNTCGNTSLSRYAVISFNGGWMQKGSICFFN